VKRTARLALRNRPLLEEALRRVLPASGRVLELGSGTGEHAVAFARAFPALAWQPSDPDEEARASIMAWSREARLPNLLPPLDLDLLGPRWTMQAADALLCVNLLHVVPAGAIGALCAGAARVLPAHGPLLVYGPFHDGRPEPRLERFDGELRAHHPSLGIRPVASLLAEAAVHGLQLESRRPGVEPGDLLLIFRRAAA
jgi:SAM-dependent methyltransferase